MRAPYGRPGRSSLPLCQWSLTIVCETLPNQPDRKGVYHRFFGYAGVRDAPDNNLLMLFPIEDHPTRQELGTRSVYVVFHCLYRAGVRDAPNLIVYVRSTLNMHNELNPLGKVSEFVRCITRASGTPTM